MTRSWSKLFVLLSSFSIFFFTNPAPTEIYTLSLHDALPILAAALAQMRAAGITGTIYTHPIGDRGHGAGPRSEEHTSELQSHSDLVCRLLLEKKNNPVSGQCHEKRGLRSSASQNVNIAVSKK